MFLHKLYYQKIETENVSIFTMIEIINYLLIV